MSRWVLLFVAVVLSLAFVEDTCWQVPRLLANQPAQRWGLLLVIPRLCATDVDTTASLGALNG